MRAMIRSSAVRTAAAVAAAMAFGGAGCAVEEPPTATTASAVTIDDVDFAPECAGIMSYTNWAPLAELDAYLPYSVASAIIERRAVTPFSSIADISSVSGIAQARLAQITNRAYNLDFIDVECAGVYEELAVSHDDRAAILAFANTAAVEQLAAAARFEEDTTAAAIVAARPFTTLQQLVDVYGVGIQTFRSLRDAAIVDPFDDVVARVNAAGWDAELQTAFDWYEVTTDQPGQQAGMTCFGVDPDLVAAWGGVLRADLADGDEVMSEVTSTVAYADRFGEVGDATAGLAHLAAQVDGQQFFGCYISFHPDPWSGVNRAFFVNTVTSYRVFSETSWSE